MAYDITKWRSLVNNGPADYIKSGNFFEQIRNCYLLTYLLHTAESFLRS